MKINKNAKTFIEWFEISEKCIDEIVAVLDKKTENATKDDTLNRLAILSDVLQEVEPQTDTEYFLLGALHCQWEETINKIVQLVELTDSMVPLVKGKKVE